MFTYLRKTQKVRMTQQQFSFLQCVITNRKYVWLVLVLSRLNVSIQCNHPRNRFTDSVTVVSHEEGEKKDKKDQAPSAELLTCILTAWACNRSGSERRLNEVKDGRRLNNRFPDRPSLFQQQGCLSNVKNFPIAV